MTVGAAPDGTTLAWADQGSGEAVVLVHSLGTDRTMWQHQAAALEGDYRVVSPDLRGHGESEAPPGPYTLDVLGADLMAVADGAGLDGFHLVGISIGGQVALWAAINHPHRLRSVVLSNTAARIGSESRWADRIGAVREHGLPGIAAMVVGGWFSEDFPDNEARSWAVAMFERTDPEGYIGCCSALATADLRDSVSEVAAPALVIGGERDMSTPPADARWLHQQIPGSRLEILAGAAHLPNLEKPGEYTTLLIDWLGQRSPL